MKGDPLESLIKKFRKKTKTEKFEWQSHSAKNLKKGTLWHFQHSFCCKISNKEKGGPFVDINFFFKKKTKNEKGEIISKKIENFEQTHSAENSKKGTLWHF